ncbi:DMT family transporter [Yersinia kristensenii]|uniref:EamA-like transporter family protein n=1 Tax=Yersinia kristensenii TaxID=28152 RepID=A0A0T9LY72_YERKR|nr:DMT family transporter [Yersinia kristensenii]MDA5521729.1 DMT family transporter [Yersinia kristensenii]MDR4896842.1 DMT family transporter [Yersinia kristensenii]MDX6736009.1 DMT family transporter [Yersinia kristensenii]OVZ79224.1 EamA-like transporter family protein [Yersinia kristensenii]PHZ37494.1 EamA-like transporter family protein [Yersinia kristensenii]
MTIYIVLALCNGIFVSLSRTINGRLGMDTNIFYASFWNHLVGFLFLTLILLVMGGLSGGFQQSAPFIAYLGGAMGALFVAINSYVLARIGSTQSALLVISGQMLTGVVIDQFMQLNSSLVMQLSGVILIIAGVWLSKISSGKNTHPKTAQK